VSWIEVRANFAEAPKDWSPIIDLFLQHGIENTLQCDLPASVIACVVEVPGAKEEIDALKLDLAGAGATEVQIGPYEEQDWEQAWKKFFKPRRIGRHFVVRPTWEEFAAEPGDHVIVLDPGQAFGTGDHATTRMCLALIEDADVSEKVVLDIGCGSGVLSIGCKLLGATQVLAVDIDPLAVEVTKENAGMNHVLIRAEVSDGVPAAAGSAPDVVLSNIISAALIRIAADVAHLIRPGGCWIVSGILNANWPDVKESAEASGFTLRDRLEEDDWVAAIFLR
jgi:ribosomal protein L11 methyltransferase